MTFGLTSPAFAEGGEIPTRYTCEGQDVSPPLAWSELYNLPPTAGRPAEAVERNALPTGTREGLNDWKRTGYGGPCPPIGRHRYFHKLYALDTVLPDLGRPSKTQLEQAMQGHLLAQTALVGTYEKRRR